MESKASSQLFYFTDPAGRLQALVRDLSELFTAEQVEAHLAHHKAYYQQVIKLKQELGLESWSLQKIIGNTKGPIANAAAQYWYHNLFWDALGPKGTTMSPKLEGVIARTYGSKENCRACLIGTSVAHFASGWYGLVFDRHYATRQEVGLRCNAFANATVPMAANKVPILVVDLWEHAYYLDFKKERRAYVEKLYEHIRWDVVEQRLTHWQEHYKSYNGSWAQ